LCDLFSDTAAARYVTKDHTDHLIQAGAERLKILAISGSLRAGSSNTEVLQAIAALAPAGVQVVLYDGLAGLPHFNPDLDTGNPPSAVGDFRAQLISSDAVVISSPEYAHGVPGSLKNALDWLVRSGELYEKPVALINVSPRSTHAQASLVETLSTMTAKLIPDASVTIALPGRNLGGFAVTTDPDISRTLSLAVAALVVAAARLTHA
jgi:chromate reductase, NAD(P)H dehydrogenase (quinone)